MEFELQRTVLRTSQMDVSEQEMLDVFLEKHVDDIVSDLVRRHYSKLCAIDELETRLAENTIPVESAEKLLKAFLADRGELFAQTRERYFRSPHRWRDSVAFQPWYAAVRISDEVLEARVQDYVIRRTEEYEGKLTEGIEAGYLMYSLKVLRERGRLQLYLKDVDGAESFREDHYKDACRYIDGRINRQGESNGQMVDYYCFKMKLALMRAWNAQVMLGMQGATDAVSAQDYLRDELKLSDVEIYEMLCHILPYYYELLDEQKRVDELLNYQPVITSKQIQDWAMRFNEVQLEDWRECLPILREFLEYDTAHSTMRDWDINFGSSSILKLVAEKLMVLFADQYADSGKRISRQTKNELRELVQVLVYARKKGAKRTHLFLTRPDVIYQVFWYYLRREFKQIYDKGYDLKRHAQGVLDTPFDIDQANRNGKFFEALVDICAEVCSDGDENFGKRWKKFWELLCSSYHCIEFEMEDLLAYRRLFSQVLRDEKKKAALDLWIREQLYGNERWLFRDLYKSAVNIERKKYGQTCKANEHETLKEYLLEYRALFAAPQADQNSLRKYELLSEFSGKFGWNYIRRKATDRDIDFLLCDARFDELDDTEKDKISEFLKSVMKSFTDLGESEFRESDLQLVLVEWLFTKLLQDRAWRQLLGIICKVLGEDEKKAV